MFVNVYALVIGLIGACWRLAVAERERAKGTRPVATLAWTRYLQPVPSWPGRADS
jgi:hypothetical protein